MTFKDAFIEFCQTTSMHGWSYIYTENSAIKKSFWILTLMVTFSCSFYFLVSNHLQYVNLPPITYIESTTEPIEDIQYPTIHLTNINQIQMSFWNQINASEENWRLLAKEYIFGYENDLSDVEKDQVLNFQKRIEEAFNWTEEQSFFEVSTMKCSDLILYARFSSYEGQNFFDGHYEINDWGKQCTISPFLDFVHPVTTKRNESLIMDGKFWHQADTANGYSRNTIENGLTLLLDVEVFDYGDFRMGSKGVFINGETSLKGSKVKEKALPVTIGYETHVAMEAEATVTTPSAVSFYDPELRQCYEDDEIHLDLLATEHGFGYTQSICLHAKALQKSIDDCSCFPDYGWTSFKNKNDTKRCRGKGISCSNKILYGSNDIQRRGMKCLTRCNDLNFKIAQVASAEYPNSKTFFAKSDSCFVFQKIGKICRNAWKKVTFEKAYGNFATCQEIISFQEDYPNVCEKLTTPIGFQVAEDHKKIYYLVVNYAKENIVHLKVYFPSTFYTRIVRDVRYSFVSYIGNAGGILGLWLGMSIISIMEIVFHCSKFASKSLQDHF